MSAMEAGRIWIFSQWHEPHKGQRTGVKITVEYAGRCKIREAWADAAGRIAFHDRFAAELARML